MEDHSVNIHRILVCERVPDYRADGEANEDDPRPFLPIDVAGAEFLDQLVYCLYVSLRLSFEKSVGIGAVADSCNELSSSVSKWRRS